METTTRLQHTDATIRTKARAYASKFAAETVLAEDSHYVEPSNKNFAEAFRTCSVIPKAHMYHLIRKEFWTIYHDIKQNGR